MKTTCSQTNSYRVIGCWTSYGTGKCLCLHMWSFRSTSSCQYYMDQLHSRYRSRRWNGFGWNYNNSGEFICFSFLVYCFSLKRRCSLICEFSNWFLLSMMDSITNKIWFTFLLSLLLDGIIGKFRFGWPYGIFPLTNPVDFLKYQSFQG